MPKRKTKLQLARNAAVEVRRLGEKLEAVGYLGITARLPEVPGKLVSVAGEASPRRPPAARA